MAFELSLSNFIILPGGRATLLVRTSTIALAVTLGLQVLLVHRYGALGSAIARAFAELAIGAILLGAALKIVRNRIPAKPTEDILVDLPGQTDIEA
jgi:O-antigen/teichoic acid export membrane protein